MIINFNKHYEVVIEILFFYFYINSYLHYILLHTIYLPTKTSIFPILLII
jgi:hypothetical protein